MPFNGASINLVAAADEEAYQLWLRNPSAPCGHIVTLRYNGTSAVYNNWVNYMAKLSDFPLAGYREVIKSLPSFSRQIADNLSGAVSESIGELVLDNTDGTLDQWHNLAFDGQLCGVYHGDPSWLPERFRLLFWCVAETVTGATRETLTIRLRAVDYGANKPIQTNLIPPAVGATAPSNTPIPLAYGQVFNASPTVIDQVNLVYQWNDGAVSSVSAGRDSGIDFNTSPIAISAVNAGTDVLSTATPHGFYAGTRFRSYVGSMPTSGWNALIWNGSTFCATSNAVSAVSPDGLFWTSESMPSNSLWLALAWNGVVFCAIAYGGTQAATSPDGVTWTARLLPVSASWNGVAWNGVVFCAIAGGSSNIAATSPDGITWTQRTLPSNGNWRAICWNGVVFCVIDSTSNKSLTSPNGIAWTAGTLPSSASWQALAWNGAVFCAIDGASNKAATSSDGITWTARTLPSSSSWYSIAWSGAVFCAISYGATNGATSPDGITWTARTLPSSAAWIPIAWNGRIFCALGDNAEITFSVDGSSWTTSTGTLPVPLFAATDYWVLPSLLTANNFQLSATRGGAPINITGTDTGVPIVGYHWTADLTTGKIYLDSSPAGEFTIDGVAGSTVAATILPTVLAATNVDTISQNRFATTCPQIIGIYIADRRNRLDVAADIMAGLDGWFGYSRLGQLQFGRVESSYAVHDLAIPQDYMDDGSFVLERMIPPEKMHRAGYRKNWTDQNGKLAAAVSAEARGLYSTPYSITAPVLGADEGSDGSEFHLLAAKPDAFETMMALGSDALTEALRRDTMFYGWGAIFSFIVGRIGAQIDIGSVLLVTHERYGFSGGVRVPVVGLDDNTSANKTTVRVFRALPVYAPGQI